MIEIGGSGRRPRWPWRGVRRTAAGIALAALAAGLVVGFGAGRLTAVPKTRHTRPPASTASLPLNSTTNIFFTGNRCALQRGTALQLGIEVDNLSGHTITVDQIRSELPLRGGLVQISSELATCGSLITPGGEPLTTIGNGASAWLSITFVVGV